MKLVILGSGSSIPTRYRNHPSIWLRYKGEKLLFDCGEGTQRQMRIEGLNHNIDRIFITHWHLDHFIGILPLLQTFKLENREKPLEIYGPEAKKFMKRILNLIHFDLGFDIMVKDVSIENQTKIYESENYKILSTPANHTVPAVAYCFKEKDRWNILRKKAGKVGLRPGPKMKELKKKGKVRIGGKTVRLEDVAKKKRGRKVVYSGDTRPSKNIEKLAERADVLIHDSTFREEVKYKHTSGEKAAEIAKKTNVKKLILIHFSRKYKTLKPLLVEAKKVFKNTELAEDFKVIINSR